MTINISLDPQYEQNLINKILVKNKLIPSIPFIDIANGRDLQLNCINQLFPWKNETYEVFMPDGNIPKFSFLEIKLLGAEGMANIMVRKNQTIYYAGRQTSPSGYLKAYQERPWIRLVLTNDPSEVDGQQYWNSYGSEGSFLAF